MRPRTVIRMLLAGCAIFAVVALKSSGGMIVSWPCSASMDPMTATAVMTSKLARYGWIRRSPGPDFAAGSGDPGLSIARLSN